MTFWRKLGILSLVLSLLDGIAGLVGGDDRAGTAMDIAAIATVLGGSGAVETGGPKDRWPALSALRMP